jgi:hypothetical protein
MAVAVLQRAHGVKTNMARKIKICIEKNCKNAQTSKEYCRLHYIKNWSLIKEQTKQKTAKRINRYIEGIMKRNPDVAHDGGESSDRENGQYNSTATEEVESMIEDLGYSDPESLDEIISNLKIDS